MQTKFNPESYWEDRLSKKFSLLGVGDFTLGEPYNKLMYKVRQSAFSNVLKILKLNLREKSILDIGSGTGFYIDLWRKKSVKKLVGSDLTEVAVKRLSEKFTDIDFKQVDITSEKIPFTHESFNVISAFDVLFHIVEDEKFESAIYNIYNLLGKGGVFIYSDNFINGETIRVQHQVSRSLVYNNEVMEKVGFREILVKPMFVLMNDPIDSKSKLLKYFYFKLTKLIIKWKWFSSFLYFTLYPIELFLLKIKKQSPSTEIRVYIKD